MKINPFEPASLLPSLLHAPPSLRPFLPSSFLWSPFYTVVSHLIACSCFLARCGTFFGPEVLGLALSFWISKGGHLSMYFTSMHFTPMECFTFLYSVFYWVVEITSGFYSFKGDWVPPWYWRGLFPVTKLMECLLWDKCSPSPYEWTCLPSL